MIAVTDLEEHEAAVELLNVLRPTVAVSWLGCFAGLALASVPAEHPLTAVVHTAIIMAQSAILAIFFIVFCVDKLIIHFFILYHKDVFFIYFHQVLLILRAEVVVGQFDVSETVFGRIVWHILCDDKEQCNSSGSSEENTESHLHGASLLLRLFCSNIASRRRICQYTGSL
jgi:hypothetical protein